ncbi:MAG: hypothetical protein WB650_05595 [Candidatus Binatus sp.]
MSRKPRIKPYHEPGGGWGATIATGKVLMEQKVLFKGALALYHMNKPGGFKCSSCAWPDPSPAHADPLVICENGAKAVAWEDHRQTRDSGILRPAFSSRPQPPV